MNTDTKNDNIEKLLKNPPSLTPEQIQAFMDEQTVFSLAVLMMDVHVGTMLKNKSMVANAFMKAGVVIQNNAGFPERFRQAKKAILERMKKQGPPKPGSTPLPTDIALGVIETQADKISSIAPTGSNPPPSQL
jgi:hypothetical protein